jgi:hypothetical protein
MSAKGLSLEQLKSELETDAQKRCIAQENTIKDLHETIKKQEKLIIQLENRCFVYTRGLACLFCSERNTCKARNREGRP